MEEKKWKILESEYLIRRPWLTARRDRIALPNGRIHEEYYVLEYPTWVNVIALTAEGQMVMVRQYRHGLGQTAYELCAGTMDPADPSPLVAAQRELAEETGYTGGTWEEYMVLSPNPATSTNLCHTFLARGVTRTARPHLDETEVLTHHLLSQDEVFGLLQRGEIVQALMAAPLWKFFGQR